jgi:hypothetical protein
MHTVIATMHHRFGLSLYTSFSRFARSKCAYFLNATTLEETKTSCQQNNNNAPEYRPTWRDQSERGVVEVLVPDLGG